MKTYEELKEEYAQKGYEKVYSQYTEALRAGISDPDEFDAFMSGVDIRKKLTLIRKEVEMQKKELEKDISSFRERIKNGEEDIIWGEYLLKKMEDWKEIGEVICSKDDTLEESWNEHREEKAKDIERYKTEFAQNKDADRSFVIRLISELSTVIKRVSEIKDKDDLEKEVLIIRRNKK